MGWRQATSDSGKVLSLRPIMPGGVDYDVDASSLPPEIASRAENLSTRRGTMDQREGALKLAQLSVPGTAGASRTFGATTKYATFTPPLIPAGGWADVYHFNATRPSGGNTAYVVGARPSGQSFHVRKITVSDAGVITTAWTDSGGNSRSVACSAVDNDTPVHLLSIYDAVAGTFAAYVNGSSSGTPLTGLASTLKPDQTTGVLWTFGVEKQTGSAVTANSHFSGLHDGMTLFTLRGMRAASTIGNTTLAETLRRHSGRVWPNPAQDCVLAHYDLDEASGTTAYDHSSNKNHGTYVGSPTVSAPVALLSAPCNFIAHIDVPAGAWNLAASFGSLFYERTSEAAA